MFLASAYTKKARDSSVTYPRFQAFALPTKQRISNVEAHAGRYTNEPHAPKRMKPHEYNYAGIYRCLVSLFGFQSCEVWNLGRQDVSVNAFSIYVCSHPLSGREQRKGNEFPGIHCRFFGKKRVSVRKSVNLGYKKAPTLAIAGDRCLECL